MTTGELERALTRLAEPAPPPDLAANVMAAVARLDHDAPQPAVAAPEPAMRWIPVLPGALLVVGAYLYGLALAEDAEGVVPPVLAGEHLSALPFDPLLVVLATGLLLCLGPLLPRASDRPRA
jgi:hypothetical protein